MLLLIRRQGTLIDVSPDGRSPLPQPIIDLLSPHLVYQHKQLLRGLDAYDPTTGEYQSIALENRWLFRLEQGRLTTGYGFTAKIARILQQAGHDVRYQDISPPRERPNCYVPDWNRVRANFEFRPRQEDCLRALVNSQGGLIDAVTGFGKTRLYEAICWLYPHAKIAIVVKPAEVADKIVSRLTRHFPNVGFFGDGNQTPGDRITVFTAGSMHYSDGDFDILLCDEVHQLMTRTYSEKLAEFFRNTRNFGQSASLFGRLDGAHAKLEMFFGPTIFRITYPEAVALGLTAPIRVRWLPINMARNPADGKRGTAAMRWGIWRNDARNRAFAEDVRANYPPDQQILMAVATIEHAVHLWQHLKDFTLCYAENEERIDQFKESGLLPASFEPVTTRTRVAMRDAFEAGTLRRVIATDIWSTGVDFDQLQVLYRCDGRESAELDTQWPGRTARIHGDKAYGEIVDAVDCWDKGFKRKSQTRKRHYAVHEWEQDWPRGRRQIGHV